jgi:putative copper resistance protein D
MAIWLAVARAVHIGASLAILGCWVFDWIVVELLRGAWGRIFRRLMAICLLTVLLSGLVWFGLVTAEMSGLSLVEALHGPVLRAVWSQTRFGQASKWRAVLWAGCVLCSVFPKQTRLSATVLAALLVVGLAWTGHAQTGLMPHAHLCADVVHLLAASAWPAGLMPFACLLFKLRGSSDARRWTSAAVLTRRFSAMSLIAVALLIASGLINSYCLLAPIQSAVSTTYGRVLLAKLALFLIMLTLGAINLLHLKPRIGGDPHLARQSCARLQLTVSCELVLGTLILLVVGILGMLPPPGP